MMFKKAQQAFGLLDSWRGDGARRSHNLMRVMPVMRLRHCVGRCVRAFRRTGRLLVNRRSRRGSRFRLRGWNGRCCGLLFVARFRRGRSRRWGWSLFLYLYLLPVPPTVLLGSRGRNRARGWRRRLVMTVVESGRGCGRCVGGRGWRGRGGGGSGIWLCSGQGCRHASCDEDRKEGRFHRLSADGLWFAMFSAEIKPSKK